MTIKSESNDIRTPTNDVSAIASVLKKGKIAYAMSATTLARNTLNSIFNADITSSTLSIADALSLIHI